MKKLALLVAMLIMTSCTQKSVEPQVVDISPIKIADVTIIQDKTTKKEVLAALGTPSDLYGSSMHWDKPENLREFFVVRYVQKDGTTFNICVGSYKQCKSNVAVYYKLDREGNTLDIVSEVNY